MTNCNGTMCHSLNCTSCFPKTGDGWEYHRPKRDGHAPEGLEAHTCPPEGWVVEFRNFRGEWIGGTYFAFLCRCEYRYKRPASSVPECVRRGVTCPSCEPGEGCQATTHGSLSLPDDDAVRGDFPMFDGLLAYFPNALAEVSKVSKIGNDQHNPGQPMHWARNKSLDHENKIMRHLVDAGKLDGRGVRHTARLAWRALAMLQEELERDQGLPPSRASTDRPF